MLMMTRRLSLCVAAARQAPSIIAVVAGACVGLLPAEGFAITNFGPYATADASYNTNVFAVPTSPGPPLASIGINGFGDTIQTYTVGSTAEYLFSGQRLHAVLEGSHDGYNRFTLLDHYEYKGGVGLDWRMNSLLDGTVSYDQTHYMAPFIDTIATSLLINTDKTVQGVVKLHITPEWRLDLHPMHHELDTPLQQFPDFKLIENSGEATLNFLGISKVTAGVDVQYAKGTYSGITDATSYNQTTGNLTGTYQVTGLSSFNGKIGYTTRDNELVGPITGNVQGIAGTTSGLTGNFGYHRDISAKTSVDLDVYRNVESYVAGANAETTTGGDIAARWNPDFRFSVDLAFGMGHDEIQGTVLNEGFAALPGRSDTFKTATVRIGYHITSWLTLRPHVSYQDRTSDFYLANYKATIYGITLAGTMPGGAAN